MPRKPAKRLLNTSPLQPEKKLKDSPYYKTRASTRASLFAVRVDLRTVTGRRFRELMHSVVGDLGGFDRLSELQQQLARRCAAIAVILESRGSVEKQGTVVALSLI